MVPNSKYIERADRGSRYRVEKFRALCSGLCFPGRPPTLKVTKRVLSGRKNNWLITTKSSANRNSPSRTLSVLDLFSWAPMSMRDLLAALFGAQMVRSKLGRG